MDFKLVDQLNKGTILKQRHQLYSLGTDSLNSSIYLFCRRWLRQHFAQLVSPLPHLNHDYLEFTCSTLWKTRRREIPTNELLPSPDTLKMKYLIFFPVGKFFLGNRIQGYGYTCDNIMVVTICLGALFLFSHRRLA